MSELPPDTSSMTPAQLNNLSLRRDPATLTRWERLKCRLGFHKRVWHRDYGWDAGTSWWCVRCGAEDEW